MAEHILVVEQNPQLLEHLTTALLQAGYEVSHVTTPADACACTSVKRVDLLLVYWAWPSPGAMRALHVLRADGRMRHAALIVLSDHMDATDRAAALDNGADDVLARSCELGELRARIRALLRRCVWHMEGPGAICEGLQLNPLSFEVTASTNDGPRSIALSPLEFRLLQFLLTHPQQVHTRDQLLDGVWGKSVCIGERTVDVHVRKLRVALKGTACADRIQTVRGGGYCFVREAPSPVPHVVVPEPTYAAASAPDAMPLGVY